MLWSRFIKKHGLRTMQRCPLCHSDACQPFYRDNTRDYLRCERCALVFVPPHQRLDAKQEKAIYDSHQNHPEDAGYRRFLSRIATPLLTKLATPKSGLDFGSGPGPTLSIMLQEAGHRAALFDTFYAPDARVWQQNYDFITATEVLEHLYDPHSELDRIWSHIKSQGYFAVMTKLVIDQQAFALWHYKNDPTHVCFYSKETVFWLAKQWSASVEFVADDAFIFQKELPCH